MRTGFDNACRFGVEVGRVEADDPGQCLAMSKAAVVAHQAIGVLCRYLDVIAKHGVVADPQ